MSTTQRNKSATLIRISHAVFQLEESRGHLKWKVQELARKVKLSRSLIYDYLGSSKKEILVSSLRHFVSDFYGFEENGESRSFESQISHARERMIQFPEAVLFYQKWRARDSWIRPEFITIEKRFQTKLKDSYPHLTETQVLTIHTAIHGAVTAPFLSSKQAGEICAEIIHGMSRAACKHDSAKSR